MSTRTASKENLRNFAVHCDALMNRLQCVTPCTGFKPPKETMLSQEDTILFAGNPGMLL